MKITASSGRSKKDLRDHCERLILEMGHSGEAGFLTSLYRALAFGGHVLIETWDGETWDECFPCHTPRQCPDCGSRDVYPRKREGVCEARCPDCGVVVGLDQTRVPAVESVSGGHATGTIDTDQRSRT